LKKYGSELIRAWNSTNPAESMQVSSVRMVPSTEDHKHSILVTVKDSYQPKSDALLLLKSELGAVFYEIFSENETYIVRAEENSKQMLFAMLLKNFGERAIGFFFERKVDIKVKDANKLSEVLNSSSISEDLKSRLKLSCPKSEPAITYPK
jgi:hypothetical protein